ncbi:hypothetical protein BT96DRAFT_913984 [Gymnopus androsaceus JB14]|uniref:Uncharacterized protein n=1 Tax=Gymnopus androsaceus JB14 TaxID=1447944 RepID=A0A6A4ICW2_9AGAR|nr:hypothetical protein BT96DRAFT_913984 [Gymnopus androsaceus JB14]
MYLRPFSYLHQSHILCSSRFEDGSILPRCTVPFKLDTNTEPPPDIPEELKGRRCYYGLPLSDEVFKTASIAAANDPLRFNLRLKRASTLLHEMGLFWYMSLCTIPIQDGVEWLDCCVFSFDSDVAKNRQCPSRAKLEEFCKLLDATPTELKWRPW